MAQSIKIMFTLAIYVSYGLQCYVPVEILLTRYFEKKIAQSDHKILYEYAIRIGVVIVTCEDKTNYVSIYLLNHQLCIIFFLQS